MRTRQIRKTFTKFDASNLPLIILHLLWWGTIRNRWSFDRDVKIWIYVAVDIWKCLHYEFVFKRDFKLTPFVINKTYVRIRVVYDLLFFGVVCVACLVSALVYFCMMDFCCVKMVSDVSYFTLKLFHLCIFFGISICSTISVRCNNSEIYEND